MGLRTTLPMFTQKAGCNWVEFADCTQARRSH